MELIKWLTNKTFMENSKMCNWVIISLPNICVLSNLRWVQSPLCCASGKRGRGGVLWGGVCCRRVPHPLQSLPCTRLSMRFPQGFCEQLRPHVSLRQSSHNWGAQPPAGITVRGSTFRDFPEPWVCTRSFASSSRNKVGTNNERDAGTSWNVPQSCQTTSGNG